MSSALMWRTEEVSPSASQSTLLREATLENRLNALRDIALTLLSEVDLLRSAPPARGEGSLNLYDEVQRFEIDLIRSALQKTNGSQVRAAQLLSVKQSTLNAKIKRYQISSSDRGHEAGRVHSHEIAA